MNCLILLVFGWGGICKSNRTLEFEELNSTKFHLDIFPQVLKFPSEMILFARSFSLPFLQLNCETKRIILFQKLEDAWKHETRYFHIFAARYSHLEIPSRDSIRSISKRNIYTFTETRDVSGRQTWHGIHHPPRVTATLSPVSLPFSGEE